jgi:Mrp family chromosome partitioning ATPase
LDDERDNPTSELCRKAGLNGSRNPFASFAYAGRAFDQLLAQAKTRYDIILIDTPPVLLFADSMFLGHFADISLLIASWNKSPRATVTEAVHRLRDNAVRVDGIVLTEVDLGQYPSFATGDRTYYLSKHRDAFHRPA